MRFDYNIVHVAGKYLYTADLLSRTPQRMSGDSPNKRILNSSYKVLPPIFQLARNTCKSTAKSKQRI